MNSNNIKKIIKNFFIYLLAFLTGALIITALRYDSKSNLMMEFTDKTYTNAVSCFFGIGAKLHTDNKITTKRDFVKSFGVNDFDAEYFMTENNLSFSDNKEAFDYYLNTDEYFKVRCYSDYANAVLEMADYAEIINYTYTSNIEKMLAVNEYMCQTFTYQGTNGNESLEEAWNTKLTNCEGFSRVYFMFMEMLGVESYIAGNEVHAWNRILMDGRWVNTDITLCLAAEIPDSYFLMSDEMLLAIDSVAFELDTDNNPDMHKKPRIMIW